MASLISIGRKKKGGGEPVVAEPVVEVAADQVAVSERAARKIAEKLVEERQPGGVFRVGIMGGGCSGLSYVFRVEGAAEERDVVFEAHGVRVCVDPKSLKYLGGTLLDWREELGKSGFAMRNPHVKSACSCGSSFSV